MLRVADLFCGPGGLSEGFQMAGFQVVFGLDNNKDALLTFEKNHRDAKAMLQDALGLSADSIPDFDVLVGGPPCVNFSSSKGGRANVLDGLRLVQAFLRVVWERKPKYWIMENVPRIALHLPEAIPLKWIGVAEKGELPVPVRMEFNCADFGVPQARRRYLIGNYPIPQPSHCEFSEGTLFASTEGLKPWRTLGNVLDALPAPDREPSTSFVVDPNYGLKVATKNLTDHFYNVELSPEEAASLKEVKTNHPYMGRMVFPDNPGRPARTIVATQLGRETLVIGFERNGKQKFRRATIRECATIQTFPITFQFWGNSLNSRYRQAGDAVPPKLSLAIARRILEQEGLSLPAHPLVSAPEVLSPAVEFKPKRAAVNRFPFDRKFQRLIPGKEVRGCRAQLDNIGNGAGPKQKSRDQSCWTPEWNARLIVGEGKEQMRDRTLNYSEALHLIAGYFGTDRTKRKQQVKGFVSALIRELEDQIEDAQSLQARWIGEDSGVPHPDRLADTLCRVVDEYFPPSDSKDKWIPRSEDYSFLPKKGLRLRISMGLLATSLATEMIRLTPQRESRLNKRVGSWKKSRCEQFMDTYLQQEKTW
jgi:DNA (cytosine-5)-methyltransferase 1